MCGKWERKIWSKKARSIIFSAEAEMLLFTNLISRGPWVRHFALTGCSFLLSGRAQASDIFLENLMEKKSIFFRLTNAFRLHQKDSKHSKTFWEIPQIKILTTNAGSKNDFSQTHRFENIEIKKNVMFVCTVGSLKTKATCLSSLPVGHTNHKRKLDVRLYKINILKFKFLNACNKLQ